MAVWSSGRLYRGTGVHAAAHISCSIAGRWRVIEPAGLSYFQYNGRAARPSRCDHRGHWSGLAT
jgi:hypothetical protein